MELNVKDNNKDNPNHKVSNNNNKYDDYTCPICLNLLYKPIITPCKHAFCHECFVDYRDLVDKKNTCPLCRGDIKESFKIEVDKEYDLKIQKLFPEETLLKKKQLELKENQHIKITIAYGNTHKLLEEPRTLRHNSEYQNKHEWSVFVRCPTEEDDRKYISKVEFELHPTFSDRIITVKRLPFSLKRVGWGFFNIPIKIFFNRKFVDSNPIELNHLLNFSGCGSTKYTKLKLKIVDDITEVPLNKNIKLVSSKNVAFLPRVAYLKRKVRSNSVEK